jgi:hypothetical protein
MAPCPNCNSEMSYVREYSQWYCHTCQLYPYLPPPQSGHTANEKLPKKPGKKLKKSKVRRKRHIEKRPPIKKSSTNSRSPSKINRKIIVAILISLIIIASIISLYWYYQDEESSPSEQEPSLPPSGPLPQIGDPVTSDSFQITVIEVEETDKIEGKRITISSKEGYKLLAIKLDMENLGGTRIDMTLKPNTATVNDAQNNQFNLQDVGLFFGSSLYFVYGSGGEMSLEDPDEAFKLTGDFTNNLWTIELDSGSEVEIMLVFSVQTDSTGLRLTLPGFTTIMLEN